MNRLVSHFRMKWPKRLVNDEDKLAYASKEWNDLIVGEAPVVIEPESTYEVSKIIQEVVEHRQAGYPGKVAVQGGNTVRRLLKSGENTTPIYNCFMCLLLHRAMH